jgi:Phosphatidylinositol-specific phospholipase C, X domain
VPCSTVAGVWKVSKHIRLSWNPVLISSIVDIYDGDKEPVITHGGTLTSKIPLRAICEAIEKSAFVTSPYPVIISAEVHCGVAQQRLVAEIMKDVFKEKLVDERIDGTKASEPLKQLPSPRMLMKRILLKVKHKAHINPVQTLTFCRQKIQPWLMKLLFR